MSSKWYVIHTYSGYEYKVKENLENQLKKLGNEKISGAIKDVFIPEEKVVEIKDGKKGTVQKRLFPGYLFVNMDMDDEILSFIRKIPGVANFIGVKNRPYSLPEEEIKDIIKQVEGREKAKPKIEFSRGDSIKVTEGPFTNFIGRVEDVLPDQLKLRVMVEIFGRATPVEFALNQVEKL